MCMLQLVAVLYFCCMKYSYFCGITCIMTKKSHRRHRLADWGLWYHFISIPSTFIKQLLCARGWAYTDQSSGVSACKSSQYLNNFLYLSVEYFCLNEVSPNSHPLPTHSSCVSELKWLFAPLSSPLCSTCVPRRMRGPVVPAWKSKPQNPRLAIWPLKWVIKKRSLHCKRPLHPVCGNKKGVFPVFPVWVTWENVSHLKWMCPWGPPGGTVVPYGLPRANGEVVTCQASPTALYFHIWPCVLVLLWQLDCKLLEKTLGSLEEDYLSYYLFDGDDHKYSTLSERISGGLYALIISHGDFPGGPVAKTLGSQCKEPGFDPWSGN